MRLDTNSPRQPASPTHAASNGSSNGVSPVKFTNGQANGHSKSDSNASVANGTTVGDDEVWQGHNKKEVTRILIQSLADLGFPSAAKQLCRESGLELEQPSAAAFRQAVLDGDWPTAELLLFGTGGEEDAGAADTETMSMLDSSKGMSIFDSKRAKGPRSSWREIGYQKGLPLANGAMKSEMLFMMRQQKYLELLEQRDLAGALHVLREELTPLRHDTGRLHALSSLMMCQSADDLRGQANWDGAAGQSRNLLLSDLSRCISPTVMLPEHRLATLLDEVKSSWIQNCLYHNTSESPSLFVDHTCARDEFPLKTILNLKDHQDEVWFLAFSPDGTMLATTGKDAVIIIYSVPKFDILHKLERHSAGVCYLAWSPDSKRLISCGKEQDNTAIVWDTETGDHIGVLQHFTYAVTAAAWSPSGTSFVVASQDSEAPLILYDANRLEKIYSWKEDNLRVYDIAISPDGSRLVALLASKILVYDLAMPMRARLAEHPMDDERLTSVYISRDSMRMLVGMNENKIKMMSIDTGEVLQVFEGHKQTQFMIRNAFGGAQETFVVSGSEDSRIYIWRTNGQLVEALEAHRPGCVNTVAWHPTDPAMFASAGDDAVVRM
ncbi:WD40 repeat-like protein [Rhizodiscina lignyota]|uniref:WD40 repeat-like protein n=1 Tax=Rhizodiscina lignyota TaxID=1504668 RepID=A0A9P4I8C0_9PEZI|nr:WD40 repeat-like protein [Rhizodiscina lignyota]